MTVASELPININFDNNEAPDLVLSRNGGSFPMKTDGRWTKANVESFSLEKHCQ